MRLCVALCSDSCVLTHVFLLMCCHACDLTHEILLMCLHLAAGTFQKTL